MFIGHLAMGFAATRAEPRLRLADALVAAQLPDVIWPVLILAGVEHATVSPGDTVVTPLRFDSYPFSHSLLTVAVWAALFAAWRGWRRGGWRPAAFLFALAVSHWVLDVASHRPDMPLWPGAGPRLGLGLWNSLPATILVEAVLFVASVWLYAGLSRPPGAGRVALGVLVGTLGVLYLGNLFGPPPPSMTAVGVSALVLVPVLWLWSGWVDRRVRPG